jgi:hypothetical protein
VRSTFGKNNMKTITRTLQLIVIASQLVAMSIADEPIKAEALNITQTYAKINAECDYNIVDAMAIDLLKFVSIQQIPIDVSEVEGILKAKNITLTFKAKKWIDIITQTADQIGASVLIGNGTIKLIAKKDAEVKQAEQVGTEQPATAPESKPEGSAKPQPESEGRSR